VKKTALALTLIMALIFSCLFCGTLVQPVKSQFLGSIYINPDGSIKGTDKIQRNENVYTLTANISGGIQVQKSDIAIDGAGYSLDEGGIDLTNGVGQDPTRSTISHVTIVNLHILNGGIGTNGGGYDTFCNVYISNSVGAGIMLIGTSYNNITYCTISGSNVSEGAIGMVYQSNYNTITKNNIVGGVQVWLSGYETVDRNYWSDYLTRYPNAKEIGNTGVGDTPYVFSTAQNGSETVYYQDNHPLMKPVESPEFPSPSPTSPSPSPSPSPSSLSPRPTQSSLLPPSQPPKPFPTTWTIATITMVIAIATVAILVYFKKRKR
jgi:hypothetical protein